MRVYPEPCRPPGSMIDYRGFDSRGGRPSRRIGAMVPIERPGKIVCVGLNYRDHAEEQGVDLPKAPLFFAKYTTSLIGPGDAIVIPSVVEQCDYEAELGVVIGQTVKNVSKENAFEAVRGYVVANDVSARDLQFADGQWTRGKSPDTFCPVGPLVPRSEVPDPHALRIRAIVSGETLQDSTTANLIFGIDEIISYASRTSTLEAGDLILTGTPAGVGVFRNPKRLLQPGDTVTIQIDGVGEITNPVDRRLRPHQWRDLPHRPPGAGQGRPAAADRER